MKQTNTLIVGASISGLSSAAALQKKGIDYIIIEKQDKIAMPWRNHYDRLHLHTPKNLSNLPYKKFGNRIPRYPTRQQVVDYLDDYQAAFNIRPVFNTEALSIKKDGPGWITVAGNETFQSKNVIVATGPYGNPRPVDFKGVETFTGKVMHSYGYKTGSQFRDKKVLVVGFGNSACEIAIDLYEQGALPSMAVRSPINVIPRDLLGIPIVQLGIWLNKLPARMADIINDPLMRLLYGNLNKLGLRKMPYGIFTQIEKEGNIPLIDIGTIRHIRKGHITIYGNIEYIDGPTVYFDDGKKENFDIIVAAIGYYRNYAAIIDVDKNRFEDLKVAVNKQKYFGKDGLYFCGFWIGPTGQIREIASDAIKIAGDIAKKEN